MENPLLSFVKKSVKNENPFRGKLLYYLTYELNQKIYYYGRHYISPSEKKKNIFNVLKFKIQDIFVYIYYFILSIGNNKITKKIILSSAYYGVEKLDSFNKYYIIKTPWNLDKNTRIIDLKLLRLIQNIKKDFRNKDFSYFFRPEFEIKTQKFITLFKKYIIRNKVCAIFLPNEMGFFEKIAIDVFRDLKLPSFDIIHGLPGYYHKATYNKTNYLCVWGEAIKNNFVCEGIPAEKIIITGHPLYPKNFKGDLRNSLENILVLGKSTNGAQFDEDYTLQDRGKSIYHLETIKKVLVLLGVKSVRLRLHPSDNPAWYKKFLDLDFFKFDDLPLVQSLVKATLVIGATSTVFVEALQNGVNFIVYEAKDENGNFIEPFKLNPPFDGSDPFVPVAHEMDHLRELILSKACVKKGLLDKYVDTAKDFSILNGYI